MVAPCRATSSRIRWCDRPRQTLAAIGAPVRVYLASDLLRDDFPAGDVRLAVMLNTFIVSARMRAAVRAKLQTGGCTVAWLYAPGVFTGPAEDANGTATQRQDTLTPSSDSAAALTGLPLRFVEGIAPSSLLSRLVPGAVVPPGPVDQFGGTFGYVTPWMYCDNETALADPVEVLAKYLNGATSLARAPVGNSTAIFIGTPGPPGWL